VKHFFILVHFLFFIFASLAREPKLVDQYIMKNIFFKKKLVSATVAGAGLAALGMGSYVLLNKPEIVTNPCRRTFMRSDGRPKVAFDSAWRANFQSLVQLICHAEICYPYEANGKYYTGHKSNNSRTVLDFLINIF